MNEKRRRCKMDVFCLGGWRRGERRFAGKVAREQCALLVERLQSDRQEHGDAGEVWMLQHAKLMCVRGEVIVA